MLAAPLPVFFTRLVAELYGMPPKQARVVWTRLQAMTQGDRVLEYALTQAVESAVRHDGPACHRALTVVFQRFLPPARLIHLLEEAVEAGELRRQDVRRTEEAILAQTTATGTWRGL